MKKWIGGLALFVLWACPAIACGPDLPSTYLHYGWELMVLDMPRTSIGPGMESVAEKEVTMEQPPSFEYENTAWGQTLGADTQDLHAALNSKGLLLETVRALTSEYDEMRRYMKTSTDGQFRYYSEDYAPEFRSRLFGSWYADEKPSETHYDSQAYSDYMYEVKPIDKTQGLDMTKYAGVFNSIPAEFSLYVGGAVLYRVERYEEAIAIWQRILQLPPEERQYRSTWAAFMIGKAYLQIDPAKAIEYFAQTQALAAEGFRDSLQLSTSSIGWMAFAESRAGKAVEAFHRYYDMWMTMDGKEQRIGRESLEYLADRLIRKGEVDAAVAQDPLCVRILMICVTDYCDDIGKAKPLVDQLVQAGGVSLDEWAGRVAWRVYSQGDFDSAAEWVKSAPADCPYAKYTHSKLLMRDGDIDGAIALLREALSSFPIRDQVKPEEYYEEEDPQVRAQGDLGMLLVSREEYVSAMEYFLAGGHWMDAAYLAERVLTPKEVESFIKAHEDDPRFAPDGSDCGWGYRTQILPPLEDLKYLLGRRLLRAGQFEKGIAFLPKELGYEEAEYPYEKKTLDLQALGEEYTDLLRKGRSASESKRDRATSLMSAAQIARERGMELMGTEVEPDWRVWDGILEYYGDVREDRLGPDREKPRTECEVLWTELLPKPSERQRVAQHPVKPDKRFHYRYVAAELMWEAAKLLPDNDPTTGRALYYAGTWLMYRDPEAANKYYKALVRRCRKLPIGQKANELRWFPKEVIGADFQPPAAGGSEDVENGAAVSRAEPSGEARECPHVGPKENAS